MADAKVITVDGTAGSGKGTLSQRIAGQLGWKLLDSGALYRLVALSALRKNVDLDDEEGLSEVAKRLDAEFLPDSDGSIKIVLEGELVTNEIRTEDCGYAASRVAAHGAVRRALLQRQRDFLQLPGLIADGRDMGTVVFPDAEVKIFLKASPEIRAKRRQIQLKQQGLDVSLDRLIRDISSRDERDCSRKDAPLVPASDAFVINTDTLDIDQVEAKVLSIITSVLGADIKHG